MPEQRDDSFEKARRNGAFDVVVLGGGINGVGVFRDLALQGLRVLLVERDDFCSACSAAPSRMIHGGLRYLENGEFGLVQESLRERDALLANAPHMVRPLPTTIPIRSMFSGLMNSAASFLGLSEAPANRGVLAIKTGLALYDWTTRHRRVLPRHVFRNARETFAKWPELDPQLRYSATYYDAWISFPERLGVELLLDVARMAPESVCLNYVVLERAGDAFRLTDKVSGERVPVEAKVLVNATGAWVDESAAMFTGDSHPPARLVSGTKGSHVILDNEPLHKALGGHMIFFENSDGRVCIVFPYLGKVLAGSTDTRMELPSRVRCEPEEMEYILDALRSVFPGISISPSQVVYSYSGIRPLPKSDHAFTGRISRGHFVHRVDGAVPQFCMVGGKWTTFRAFAEQAADAVLAELCLQRVTDTIAMPIGGGDDFPAEGRELAGELANSFEIDALRAEHLVETYGTRSREVVMFSLGREDNARLDNATAITTAEIVFLIRHEFVVSLADLLLRRTSLAICGDLSMALVEKVADVLAKELSWDVHRRDAEVQGFLADLDNYHGVSREMLDQRTKSRRLVCA